MADHALNHAIQRGRERALRARIRELIERIDRHEKAAASRHMAAAVFSDWDEADFDAQTSIDIPPEEPERRPLIERVLMRLFGRSIDV